MNEPGYLFDTSVWLALAFAAHPFHALAQQAFLAATSDRKALFCRATQQSALRILSTERIATHYKVAPISNRDALAIVDAFMGRPSVGFIDEPPNVAPHWRSLADLTASSPKRWMDAYLAAFSIAAGLQFVIADKDFAVFAGLSATI